MATPGIQTTHNLPTIALVGRANVGKSTLFNALLQENKALVSDIAGTTRTINRGISIWRGKEIMIVDTGGVDNDENEQFADEILAQADEALDEADIIVMVTDLKTGIMPQERDLAHALKKKYKKPIMLIANKADSQKLEREILNGEWAQLALGEPFPMSATNGRGIGDFLDLVYSTLQKMPIRPKKTKKIEDTVHISLIGKPNVGKSSLFNKLIGQDKVIVSDIAHTTREPYDTEMTYEFAGKKHRFTFVDTAGIRRKANVKGKLEREGIARSIKSIEDSNIVLLVLDGSEPISSQDMQLGGLIERRSKSVIIIVNKWDLAEDNSDTYRNQVIKMIYSHFPHLDFAPIVFTSGKTGYRIQQIFPLLVKNQ